MTETATESAALDRSTVADGLESSSFFAQDLTDRQKMTSRPLKWALGLLIAFVLVVVIAIATQIWRSAPSTAKPESVEAVVTLPVTTFVAKQVESYTRQRSYTGMLVESRRSQLSFQRGGELLQLLVDEGQTVEAGQILGRLDARHIRARQAQLEAKVAEAKAVLEELVSGPRQETIAAKRAELRAQQSQRQVLSGQLERRKQLVRSASVSREEYETFLYDYKAAVAREEVVKRQLEEMLAGTRVEKIAAQRARLSQWDAELTDTAHDFDDTKLVAPFAGRVARRLVDEGKVIAAGSPVLEVIDNTNLEAWIGLPPAAALALRVGQQHELKIAGKTIKATVQSLAPEVQRTSRTRNVILRLDASASEVLPGQVVRLALNEQVKELGYWVPTTALTRGTRGLWSLYVVDESVVTRRDVEVLDTVGSDSFVRGTLQPGDTVVASGTHRVVVGQRVMAVQREKVARRQP